MPFGVVALRKVRWVKGNVGDACMHECDKNAMCLM
jgi:ribonuclease HI